MEGRVITLVIPAIVPDRVETESLKLAPRDSDSDDPPKYSPSYLNARILVAEDQRDNQAVIALRLKLAGAAVTIVSNGLEAVNAAIEARDQGLPFDLVLMDMQMPVLDGYGAAKALRDEGFDRLPIVALTAHALPEDRDECLRYGCDDYLTKPISWNALYQTLADLLNRAANASFSTTG